MKQRLRQDLDIGTNIRKLRIARNYTQPNIVAQLQTYGIEISRGYYSRIEIGELNAHVSVLVALKEILNCDYKDFFEGLREQLEVKGEQTPL